MAIINSGKPAKLSYLFSAKEINGFDLVRIVSPEEQLLAEGHWYDGSIQDYRDETGTATKKGEKMPVVIRLSKH